MRSLSQVAREAGGRTLGQVLLGGIVLRASLQLFHSLLGFAHRGKILIHLHLIGAAYLPPQVAGLFQHVIENAALQLAAFARKNLAVFEKFRDLVNIGAYVKGSDPEADTALLVIPEINRFLQQDVSDVSSFSNTLQSLTEISHISSVN